MSLNLEKSFEQYRETSEYKEALKERMNFLESLGISTDFADMLAMKSVDTQIEVTELLEAKDQILEENKRINNIDDELDDDIQNIDNIVDITQRVSQDRIYGGTGYKKAA